MSLKQLYYALGHVSHSVLHFLKLLFGNVSCDSDSEYWMTNKRLKERNIFKCFLSLLYKLIGTVVPTVSLL